MQSQNSLEKINLSQNFPERSLTNLIMVFPQLKNIINKESKSNAFSAHQSIYVEKFTFYQIILEKIKNYFEIKEKFVIADSISIILKNLKDITQNSEKKKSNLKKKVQLPLINRIPAPNIKDNSSIKTCRNYSTKSNGSKKINGPKSAKLNINESFNSEEPNFGKINYVYLNLDKFEKPKLKIVKFVELDTDIEFDTKRNKKLIKSATKKSNLKKSNIKKEMNKTLNFNLNDLKKEKNKRNLFIKLKTEYPLRNKSNGIRLKEKFSSKEKSINKEKSNSRDKSISIEKSISKENHESKNKEKYIIKKQMTTLYNSNLNELYNIDDKDFDIFNLEEKVGKENTLPLIGNYIFKYFNFGEIINQTKYINWCKKISEGYNRNNPYHTDLHAADITHTSYIFFKIGEINKKIKLDKSSICALFLSCICHDYKHPGLNNNYLIETNNLIALNYNDLSVLENMHISEAFKLIHSNEKFNIFENFDKNEYKKIRKQMISCVLSTDMSHHKNALDFMNKQLNEKNQTLENSEQNCQNYMNLIIHSADISNPTKKFDIYYKWAELVVEEFYQQGDKEKELGLNCSFDRNKTTLYKTQLGFIDYVEIPFYSLFVKVFPKLNFLYENMNNNREKIKLLEDEENKNKERKENN